MNIRSIQNSVNGIFYLTVGIPVAFPISVMAVLTAVVERIVWVNANELNVWMLVGQEVDVVRVVPELASTHSCVAFVAQLVWEYLPDV